MAGWQTAPCAAVDGTGARCALAAGHDGEHRTSALLAANAQSAWIWRVLIAAGVGAVALYVVVGWP